MLNITNFSSNTLNLRLYPIQSLILTQTWEKDTSHVVLCLGRRSGKTMISAVSALYAAIAYNSIYKKLLGRKKDFTIYLIANSRAQAKILLQNIKDLIDISTPRILKSGKTFDLRELVLENNKFNLALDIGVNFVALATTARGARGEATPLILMDEIAHSLDTDGDASANNLYQALKPGTAQFGEHSRTMMFSSPWNDEGLFYDYFQQGALYDPKSKKFITKKETKPSIKVFQLPTWDVNYSISRQYLRDEEARDPELFGVEYGAQFSKTLTRFIHRDLVDDAIIDKKKEQDAANPIYLPNPDYRFQYSLGFDPAKGKTAGDDYIGCLSHYEYAPDPETGKDRAVLIVDFWKYFSAGDRGVVSLNEITQFVEDVNNIFGIDSISCDQYESSFIIDTFSDSYNIYELTWSLRTHTIIFQKIKQMFFNDAIKLAYCKPAIKQIKNAKKIMKPNKQFKITGGDGVAVDDYLFAMALSAYHAPMPGLIHV